MDNLLEELSPAVEGNLPFDVPGQSGFSTYYKVFGDLKCGKTPLIVLHGGPGAEHGYLLPFASLWKSRGIPVVLYDQIGCGKATHDENLDGDLAFWSVDLFIKELENVIDRLGLEGYSILGHSWGGVIASEMAAKRPKGLKRLVLASAISSQESSQGGYGLNVARLPAEYQDAIHTALVNKDYGSPRFKDAMMEFSNIFRNHAEPNKPSLIPPGSPRRPVIWKTMMGETLLDPSTGVLRDWSVVPRLHKIDVPTLVYNGDFDACHNVTQIPFFENIPKVRWFTFANAGHMIHSQNLEMRLKCMELVGHFLEPKT